MKIKSINLTNFRTYKNLNISLEDKPNIILIYGNNGYGKTAIFDGIEWGLTGKIKRFENSLEKKKVNFLKNCFSPKDEIGKVKIGLTNDYIIEREIEQTPSEDYSKNKLVEGISDEHINQIIFNNIDSHCENLNRNFNFSYILSQDLISDFMKRTKEQDRYEQLSEFFGLNEERSYQEFFAEKQTELKTKISKLEKESVKFKSDLSTEYIQEGNNSSNEEFKKLDFELKNNLNENIDIKKIERLIIENKKDLSQIETRSNDLKTIYSILLDKELFEKSIIEIEYLTKRNAILTNKIGLINKSKEILEVDKYLYNKNEISKGLEDFKREKSLKNIQLFNEILSDYYKNLEMPEYISYFLNKNKDKELFIEDYKLRLELLREIDLKIKKKESLNKLILESDEIYYNFNYYSKKMLGIETTPECPLCGNNLISVNELLKKLDSDLKKKTLNHSKELDNQLTFLIEDINKVKNKLLKKEETLLKKIKDYINEINLRKSTEENLIENFEKLKEVNYVIDNFFKKYGIESLLEYNLFKNENIELLKKYNISLEKENEYQKALTKTRLNLFSKKNKELEKYKEYKEKINEEELKGQIDNLNYTTQEIKEMIEKLEKYKYLFHINENIKRIKNIENKINSIKNKVNKYNEIVLEFETAQKSIKSIIEKRISKYIENHNEIINKFYNYLNPHKKFENIKLIAKNKPKIRSELGLQMSTVEGEKYNPVYFFSSAQSNTLALSIFLGLNLISNGLNLNTILLDDPIQNMDDINIHSFVDLLKQISFQEDKQIIISTHDDRIAEYMKFKLGENLHSIKLKSYGEI